MKIFKDLQFKPHKVGDGLQAALFFENGYGVSVVRFKTMGRYGSYTDNESQWELAVLIGNENKWHLTYDTPITDNVMGYLSEKDVSQIMEKIQKLPIAELVQE